MKTRLLLNYTSSSDSGQRTSNHYRYAESDTFSYTDAFTLVMFSFGNFCRFETPARRMSIVLVGGWSMGSSGHCSLHFSGIGLHHQPGAFCSLKDSLLTELSLHCL